MTAPTAVIEPPPEGAPTRRRRRWPWVLLVILVVIAALAVTIEVLARQIVPGIVRDEVAQTIELPADQELEVRIEGVLLMQLIGGRLGTVHLTSEAVTFGELTGAVEATATDVPVFGGPLGGITGTFSVTAAEFAGVLAASDLPLGEVVFDEGTVTLTGAVGLLGFRLPIAVGVEPDVVDGRLLLRPADFRLGDLTVDTAELAARLGQFGVDLAGPYPVCIEDRLPQAILLRGIEVTPQHAVIALAVDGRITVDPALQELGSCEG